MISFASISTVNNPMDNRENPDAAFDFAAIEREHRGRIYGLAFTMTRDREVAEDIAQDAFVRLLSKGEDVVEPAAWLNVVTRNLVIDRARRAKHAPSVSLETGGQSSNGDGTKPLEFPCERPGAVRLVEREELGARVRLAISELPAWHRDVVMLHHVQGLEVADIAARLNAPVGTVKSRLSRARDALGRKLSGYVFS